MNKRLSILSVFLLIAPLALLAAQPNLIHYQARVQDAAGHDINGPVTVGFRLYGSLAGATVLWGETQNLTAAKGIISVDLGAVDPFPAGVFSRPELYLGVTAAGDPEMTPRTRLLSTWKAASASRVSGKTVQAGNATLSASSSATAAVAITFPEAFRSAPVVIAGAPHGRIGSEDFIVTHAETTTTSCTVHFRSLSGSPATGSAGFDWIAIGE